MSLNHKYDIYVLMSCANGNPNGDPDADNYPRFNPETGKCMMTSYSFKHKIKETVKFNNAEKRGYRLLTQAERPLNDIFAEAYSNCDIELNKKEKNNIENISKARKWLMEEFFDVRTFGAVMSTGDNPCGIVNGPVQVYHSDSVSPVSINELSIIRLGRTTADRLKTGSTEMGKTYNVKYALFPVKITVSPAIANKDGILTDEDIEELLKGIEMMFEVNQSATRGECIIHKLLVFKHDTVKGSCFSHELFNKVKIKEKNPDKPITCYEDYEITIDENMPEGVELIKRIDF